MKLLRYAIFILILTFYSCDRPKETNLSVHFTHTIDNNTLIMGTGCMSGGDCLPDHSCCTGGELLPYTNNAGEKYNIQRLEYLISDIKIHTDDGNSRTLKDLHFIDANDQSTCNIDAGIMENSNYTSISFTMGLDTNKNQSNLYVNESFHANMAWPDIMGGGYHYMKIEGDYDTITKGYATHTGGTMGMDHSFNNIFDISLDINDELGDVDIYINMEINNWYTNPHNINLAASIMADMQKQMELQTNGEMDVFSITIDK